jgi:hypothetical protein
MKEAEETVDDLNSEKWDTVFLSLPALVQNSCRSKYISRTQSTPGPLLKSGCIKMTMCSVKWRLEQLSQESVV